MKTQILLLKILIIAIVFCTACSKNDDADDNSKMKENLFKGTWKPVEFVIVCSSGNKDLESYSTCEQTGRLKVNENGTWSETYFYEYVDDMCEEDGVDSGTWKIVDNKLFVIESGFSEGEITYFEITENTLRVGQYDDDFECDGNLLSSHYYRNYIRI